MGNKYNKAVKNKASVKGRQVPPSSKKSSNLFLLPMIFIIAILPLIVKMRIYSANLSQYEWFTTNDTYFDFFLYYKQTFLIVTAVVMLSLILYRYFTDKSSINFTKLMIPLAIYALLAFLSSIFSKYRSYSFSGVYEQFESIFAILSYCVLVYYAYSFIKSERDLKVIIYTLLICAIILSLLGLTQVTGHDFYHSQTGWSLISNSAYVNHMDEFTFTAGDNRVYLSFYNPNYVGAYVSLVIPILFFMLLFSKKLWQKLLFLTAILGLLICLYGSKSTAGFISVAVAIGISFVLLWRYVIKYYYISIPLVALVIVALFIINAKYNNYIGIQINKLTNIQKSSPALSEIQTNDDNILIKYNGNDLKVTFTYDANGFCNFSFLDENDAIVPSTFDTVNGPITITDERFSGFTFTPTQYGDIIGFTIPIAYGTWFFTNQTEDHTYYYMNPNGRLTKLITAPSAVFTGYEQYASGRGYIWSRSIPLLKDKVFLGSGADTFVFEFPQLDYINLSNYGYLGQLMTKPHSLYLQIAVQSGILSLIAFITFYLLYFISSIRIYIKGKFNSLYKVIGASIFVGSFGYMICGLSNDSSITVAPIFWLFIGVGMAINRIIKNEQIASSKGIN